VQRVTAIGGYVTYFELLVEEPVAARIGIALSRDPQPEPSGRIESAHLAGVQLLAVAVLDAGTIHSRGVAGLRPGSVVGLRVRDALRCRLRIADQTIAAGVLGVRHGFYAVRVDAAAPNATR
jgi:hypothetical protein